MERHWNCIVNVNTHFVDIANISAMRLTTEYALEHGLYG
jgi:hypothetical protein